jgi:hypothetical protein
MGSLANSASTAEVARAKSNQQNLSVSNDAARFYRCGMMTSRRLGHALTLGCIRIRLNVIHSPMGQNTVSQRRWQKKVSIPK